MYDQIKNEEDLFVSLCGDQRLKKFLFTGTGLRSGEGQRTLEQFS